MANHKNKKGKNIIKTSSTRPMMEQTRPPTPTFDMVLRLAKYSSDIERRNIKKGDLHNSNRIYLNNPNT